jgi:hypothetical protein
MIHPDQITNWFSYHPPVGDQAQTYEIIRAHAREFAHILNSLVPDGADKTAAMRKLREVVMTANAAVATSTVIARAGDTPTDDYVAAPERTAAEVSATAVRNVGRSPYQDSFLVGGGGAGGQSPVSSHAAVAEFGLAGNWGAVSVPKDAASVPKLAAPPTIDQLASDYLASKGA